MGIVNDASRRDDVVAAAAPPTVDRDEFARLCIDQRRGRRAERRRLLRLPVTAPPAPTVAVEERETAGQVAAAVAALPERERACFLLTVCEGLSYRDAAEALGLSFAEVNNAIHRARRGLRVSLGGLVAFETRHR